MAEKTPSTPEELDADKLGTKVTYLNPDGSAKETSIQGVTLKEGEAVDLAETLPEAEARALAKKLALNPFFQVEGGPKRDKPQAEGAESEAAKKAKEDDDKSPATTGTPPDTPKPPGSPTFDDDDEDDGEAGLENPIRRGPGRPPKAK